MIRTLTIAVVLVLTPVSWVIGITKTYDAEESALFSFGLLSESQEIESVTITITVNRYKYQPVVAVYLQSYYLGVYGPPQRIIGLPPCSLSVSKEEK